MCLLSTPNFDNIDGSDEPWFVNSVSSWERRRIVQGVVSIPLSFSPLLLSSFTVFIHLFRSDSSDIM